MRQAEAELSAQRQEELREQTGQSDAPTDTGADAAGGNFPFPEGGRTGSGADSRSDDPIVQQQIQQAADAYQKIAALV